MAEPLVGRDRELAQLTAGLEDALSGHGRLFLLAGEAGIGKTTLAHRLAEEAGERGARVVWARPWEGGGGAPYWTWAQVVRGLVEGLDEETLRPLLAPGNDPLALLSPELADRFGDAALTRQHVDSAAGRFSLFGAVARFLGHVASLQPVVLILDDLPAGDRPSLLLLRFVAPEVRRWRLLVVATLRDFDAGQEPEVAEVMSDLVRDGHLVQLVGLSRSDVARLIAALTGTRPWQGKVEAIYRATEGNPLFVREMTRLAATTGALDRPGDLAVPVPGSVRAVIHRRLAPLSADAIQALAAAAVVGRRFDVALVSAAADLPVERVLESLSDAVRLGALEEVPGAAGEYRFSHQLVREAVYEGLPGAARTQMHQRVGREIERRHGAEPTSHLGELAYHFGEAAAVGGAAKAVSYARRAADRAMEAHAYEDAVEEYRRALTATRFAEADRVEECELLLGLGDARARSGDYEAAKESFLRAADIARRIDAPELLARAALGYGEPQVEGGLVDQRLVALLREALAALRPDDSPLRARLLARLSLEFTFSDDEVLREAQRDSLSREALEMARRLGDAAARAAACRARWMAVWGPRGLAERMALSEDLLGLARDTGDRELELVGRARRITCSLEYGDRTAADTDIAEHTRLAADLRMPYHEWAATTLRAGQAILDGSLETAERLADHAVGLLPGRPGAAGAHLNQITAIRWEQGRLGELRDAWADLVMRFPQAGFARGWLCLADAELGREEPARESLATLADSVGELPRNGLWLPALAVASLAASRLDDASAAGRVHDLLVAHADHTVVLPMPHPVLCLGPVALYLALLATVRGRWDEAEHRFEAAMRANRRLRARALLARTGYEAAKSLIRRGRAADRRRALALLDRAEAGARELGMAAIVAACEQLRDTQAGRLVPDRPSIPDLTSAVHGNVFRREGDYWTVVYDGSLVRLRDAKGLRLLARLLASPGREFAAVDLEAAGIVVGGAARRRAGAEELEHRADLGDAGELLDATAKAQYRARLNELQQEVDEAESWGDPIRAVRARQEMDFLVAELARAVGLGGRDRKAAAHAERARLNATRAIRSAIRNLSRAHPSLGRHLEATVRTGRYCSYTPDPGSPVVWTT